MHALFGWLVASLIRGGAFLFKTKLGFFVASAFVWLGINFASLNIVIQPTIDMVQSFAQGTASGGGGTGQYWSTAMEWMGVLNFDKALTMVLSAYGTKVAILNARLFLFRRGVGA